MNPERGINVRNMRVPERTKPPEKEPVHLFDARRDITEETWGKIDKAFAESHDQLEGESILHLGKYLEFAAARAVLDPERGSLTDSEQQLLMAVLRREKWFGGASEEAQSARNLSLIGIPAQSGWGALSRGQLPYDFTPDRAEFKGTLEKYRDNGQWEEFLEMAENMRVLGTPTAELVTARDWKTTRDYVAALTAPA